MHSNKLEFFMTEFLEFASDIRIVKLKHDLNRKYNGKAVILFNQIIFNITSD